MLLEETASIFATSKLRNHSQRVAHTTRGTTSQDLRSPTTFLAALDQVVLQPHWTCLLSDLLLVGPSPMLETLRFPDPWTRQRCSFTANLTRSQRIDVDKRVTIRVVVVDACAVAQGGGWMRKRWQPLSEEESSKRDSCCWHRPATAKSADAQSIVTTRNTQFTRGLCLNFHFTTSPCCVSASRCCGTPQ